MAPRVVVIGLASDFGCQVQMTNIEDHLLDVLGLVDLSYWQLASSGHMPAEYEIAIVEGAVTLGEHVRLLERVRETAAIVMALGSCAATGGIPALANGKEQGIAHREVYGEKQAVAQDRLAAASVASVVDVDYVIPGCPIDVDEFLKVLSRALHGLTDKTPEQPMCFACKTRENVCFFDRGELCLGLITRSGCHARCVSFGRPCTACRGIAPEANLQAARQVMLDHGIDPARAAETLSLYNRNEEVGF